MLSADRQKALTDAIAAADPSVPAHALYDVMFPPADRTPTQGEFLHCFQEAKRRLAEGPAIPAEPAAGPPEAAADSSRNVEAPAVRKARRPE